MNSLQEIGYLSLLFIVIVATMMHLILHFLQKNLHPKAVTTGHSWSAATIRVITGPGTLLTWYVAFTLILTYYYPSFRTEYLLKVGVVGALMYGLKIVSKEIEEVLVSKKWVDGTTAGLFTKLSAVCIVFISLLLVLPLIGIDVGGLLAFGGFSGIIVGLASKDMLSNILGGFAIAIDKPFRNGDWVYCADGSLEGIIEHVGWRLTRLRTMDKRALFIPNSSLSGLNLVNASLMTHQKIAQTLYLMHDGAPKLDELTLALRQYIKNHPKIDIKELHSVSLLNVTTSGLELYICACTRITDKKAFYELTQTLLLDIIQLIKDHNLRLATPSLLLNNQQPFSLTSSVTEDSLQL